MIIVNQSRNVLVNFNRVESIDILEALDEEGKTMYEISYETTAKREEIGNYETEERAKEVLEEIIQLYLPDEFYKKTQTCDRMIAMNTAPKIYRMPLE